MAHLLQMYRHGFGLMTDLYQLTMAYGYWKNNIHDRPAVFNLFYRKNPFQGKYVIACGLELVIDFLQNFQFSADDIQYLRGLQGADNQALFSESFLNYLQGMTFNCSIDAIPEGTVVFPHEPLLRVQGPLLQAQLIETILLNLINFSSLIATKASRVVQAAGKDTVLEFGFRRAQGVDGSLTATRSTYVGGCHATSNVLAGKLFDIPVKGTHAHSWVMCFEDELEAFNKYAEAMPNNCIFLVDTYNSIKGIENAIKVGNKLKTLGHEMLGIRLDSGDLKALSIKARKMLDEAGFNQTAIVGSNNLNEIEIKKLKEDGAEITVWGVGTHLVTAYDEAALGGVYKLAAIQNKTGKWEHKLKLSEQAIKVSNPGILQVKRFFNQKGSPIGDMLYNSLHPKPSTRLVRFDTSDVQELEADFSKNLLVPIFQNGELVYNLPSIHETRDYCLAQQGLFSQIFDDIYPCGLEEQLFEEKMSIINDLKN